MKYDIVIVGVGGQGVLTIGNFIAQTALQKGIPAYYYPLKGMAQRGGFVKVQVRLGRENPGPHILPKGADLVIAMERSESLKAISDIKTGKEFILYDYVWPPTAVVLGKEPYPSQEQVREEIKKVDGKIITLIPDELPVYEGSPVPPNVYILGVIMGHTPLAEIIDPPSMLEAIKNRWEKAIEPNSFAFNSGLEAEV